VQTTATLTWHNSITGRFTVVRDVQGCKTHKVSYLNATDLYMVEALSPNGLPDRDTDRLTFHTLAEAMGAAK
jgi:hypothetical protein